MKSDTVVNAIAKRHNLRLTYHGFHRIVEPHAYGLNKDHRPLLRCWQTSGGSDSGEHQGWKLLFLDEVHQLVDTEEKFATPRIGYRPGDTALTTIYAQL